MPAIERILNIKQKNIFSSSKHHQYFTLIIAILNPKDSNLLHKPNMLPSNTITPKNKEKANNAPHPAKKYTTIRAAIL